MTKFTPFALTPVALLLLPRTANTQARQHYSLESPACLRLHNVTAEPATFRGKKCLRLMPSEAAARQFERMTPEEQRQSQLRLDHLALIENLDFSSGVIEAGIAGAPAPGTFEGAQGFVGIALRVQANNTYEAFYLRPTNGRAEDQARRNRSGKYETYVDLVPGEWTKVKTEVAGERARLYIHDQEQPALIVTASSPAPT